ncbi:MAG TPA: apolipoprotein N-acyltransferase [Burkholderiales bacterium]|nr:apolipoprotein N-acyltransferase [Burkholderiales bacterium]
MKRRYAIAFLAGAATVLAFAPAGIYPLALVTFAGLIELWMRATPRRAALLGLAFGLGLFGAGVSWVYVSLHRFGGMPGPIAAVATLGFCALIALFPAGAGWLQARLPASPVVRACLVIPASWTLFEWLRSWVLTGFPWLSVGYAAVGWPTQWLAPITGVFGLSFVTLALAGLLWTALRARRRWLPVLGIAAVLAGSQALALVAWSVPHGPVTRVALLQGNIAQDMKFDPARYERILETYARLAEESRARLIVLPETALPRFHDRVAPHYFALLEAIGRRNDGDVILGVPFRAGEGEYYNSALSFGVSPRQAYHKRHLVPFGEFVPPGFAWVMRLLNIPFSDFSRGAPVQAPLQVAGQRVAVNICYEDAFGDEIARQLPEATLLVNMSNVAWFGDSLAPAQHLQIARLRAIETARMHLAATNTGITAAIDRDGTVLMQLPQFVEGRLVIDARGYAGPTPYVRWGDWPAVVAMLALLLAVLFVAWRAGSAALRSR